MPTKAQTLKSLFGQLKNAIICDAIVFTVNEWEKQKKDIIKRIQLKFSNDFLIIRSSALEEDGLFTPSNPTGKR